MSKSDPEVKKIQQLLNGSGYLAKPIEEDGICGNATVTAVKSILILAKNYQKSLNFTCESMQDLLGKQDYLIEKID
jgi:peptidoglycan hydrolase-like protein with peptidoglycan-binding domain